MSPEYVRIVRFLSFVIIRKVHSAGYARIAADGQLVYNHPVDAGLPICKG
jgi:hypothetical protein